MTQTAFKIPGINTSKFFKRIIIFCFISNIKYDQFQHFNDRLCM